MRCVIPSIFVFLVVGHLMCYSYGSVMIREDLLTPQDCSDLVKLLDNGDVSWNIANDILDGRTMDQSDIFERGWVIHDDMYDMVMHNLEWRLRHAIEEYTPTDVYLYWMFVRRYRQGVGSRDRLKPHRDVNAITINILLNDNYDGGELYLLNANSSLEIAFDSDFINDEFVAGSKYADYFRNVQGFADDLTIAAPKAGTVVIHDNTVVHGVAPVTAGVRFTLIIFYRSFLDMSKCFLDDTKEWDEDGGECYCIDGYEPDFSVDAVDNHFPCIPYAIT